MAAQDWLFTGFALFFTLMTAWSLTSRATNPLYYLPRDEDA